MASWNFTSAGPLDAFVGVNTLTNGLFGPSLVVIIWLVVFFRQNAETNRDRILAANFLAFFASLFFALIGIVNSYFLGVVVVLFVGSFALLMTRPS